MIFKTSTVFATATITIINADGANEGFNDTTAFTAVAGNTAATLGQARLNALQHAANILGSIINSNIDIKVNAVMNPLGGDASSATLAGAGAPYSVTGFANIPFAGTYYSIALAEKIAGTELSIPVNYEIGMTVNSDIDGNTVLGTTHWYYGLDSSPPAGDVDFITVMLHELIHGIGFSSGVDLDTGQKLGNAFDDSFMRLLEHHGAATLDYPTMVDAGRIAASIDSTYDMSVPPVITATNLHWVGTAVLTQLSANPGFENNHATMYAPNPREIGSSVSHFSTLYSPTEMMEPAYTRADHNISLANYLLTDIGWGTTNINTNTTNLSVTITDSEITIIAGNNETYSLVVSNNSATVATEAVLTYMIPAGATFISATPNNATTCFQSNNIVTCHLGNLTMAVPVNIAIVLTLNTVGTNINTAFIDSVNPDSPIANNANTQNTLVEAVPVPPVAAPSGGGGGCFIATAAYGSNMESDVRYLRAFRDEHLLTNSPGRWFVQMYYRYSPSIANTIREHKIMKSAVRVLLSPLVAMSKKSVSQKYLDLQK